MRSNRDLYLFVLVFGLAHVGITYWSMQVGTLRGVLTGLCCIVIWLCLAALFRHDARREREAQQALPPLPVDWSHPSPTDHHADVRRAIRALARNRRRNRTTV